jgi:hypothetical protein
MRSEQLYATFKCSDRNRPLIIGLNSILAKLRMTLGFLSNKDYASLFKKAYTVNILYFPSINILLSKPRARPRLKAMLPTAGDEKAPDFVTPMQPVAKVQRQNMLNI